MVILGTSPPVPAPRLVELADRLETAARDAARESLDPFDRDVQRVSDSLAMLSIVVRRMSESGPLAHAQSLRHAFREHFDDSPDEPDPLVDHRARLDVISFLTVGDMVLDDAATVVLRREDVPPGDYPWRTFARWLDAAAIDDPTGPMVRTTRTLDLLLREARHRLVAHRLAPHYRLFAWASDGTQEVDLVDPDGVESAYRLLSVVAKRIGLAAPVLDKVEPGDYYALLREITWRAGELDGASRGTVRQAFKEAGYGFAAPKRIIDAVIGLVRAARVHPRREPAPI